MGTYTRLPLGWSLWFKSNIIHLALLPVVFLLVVTYEWGQHDNYLLTLLTFEFIFAAVSAIWAATLQYFASVEGLRHEKWAKLGFTIALLALILPAFLPSTVIPMKGSYWDFFSFAVAFIVSYFWVIKPHSTKVYLLTFWNLYWRIAVIHFVVVLYAVLVVAKIGEIVEPSQYPLIGMAEYLLFVAYCLIFIPIHLIFSIIVAFFYRRNYRKAGIILAIVFQALIILLLVVGTFVSGEYEGLEIVRSLLSIKGGLSTVLYSYGAVLVAALYWSSVPRPPRIPKTGLQPDWNSVDN